MPRKILIIAGLDPTAGAGLVRDAQTARSLGCHPLTVASALTAQAGGKVSGVWPVEAKILRRQVGELLRVYHIDGVKVGLVAGGTQAEVLAELLRDLRVPVVLDPVLAASGGDHLFAGDLRGLEPLLQVARLVTPNLAEASALAGFPVGDRAAMEQAARRILDLGPRAVLVTGGHLPGGMVADLLWDGERLAWFTSERRPGSPRGTGCFLSTAVACGLASGLSLPDAVEAARRVLLEGFETSYALESGEIFFR